MKPKLRNMQPINAKPKVPVTNSLRRVGLSVGWATMLLLLSPQPTIAQNIELVFPDGSESFAINGVEFNDLVDATVANAGDINDDGIDDLIIGAPRSGARFHGQVFVVFGSAAVGVTGSLELSDLNGSNGFVISGIDQFDNAGFSVSGSGDVNGDGVDDIIIGARMADATGTDSGETYVIFGGANVGSSGAFNPASLNGSNGFVIRGIGDFHFSGSAVSNAGDVNGDGFDDIIIGASQRGAARTFNFNENSEQSYVVFGGSTVVSSGIVELSNLNGSNGFAINGFDAIDEFDLSFLSVSTAGDINDDGFDDVIIGAPSAAPNGSFSGASYVIFGNANVGSSGTIQWVRLENNVFCTTLY